MKFTKLGKALLLSALSAGIVLSVTSCIQSYTVGYLYVMGTVTAEPSGNGIVSGFKIDHNTGKLIPINGLPVASGGANPGRAVLFTSIHFLYVLNRGVNKEGGSDCTTADPCLNSNITQFSVGANGILTPQQTFYTQGINPFRIIGDTNSNYIYVLDHDSPVTLSDGSIVPSSPANPNSNCAAALGNDKNGNPITTCGDITAFKVDTTTGRLSLIVNSQVTSLTGTALPYFPVPSDAIDFVEASGYILTLTGTPTIGDTVFSYGFSPVTGQLSVVLNSVNQLTNSQNANGLVNNATAIVFPSGSYLYVLDNEPITVNGVVASQSQILPYQVGASGSLNAATSGAIPDDANQANPIYITSESKGKWFYVANYGNNTTGTGTAQSGIAGFVVNTPYLPTEMAGAPIGFGTGGGPVCLVEDPSNQFFYTANFNDSTVSGQALDEQAGELKPLSQATHAPSSYSLTGQPTWCLIDNRTN